MHSKMNYTTNQVTLNLMPFSSCRIGRLTPREKAWNQTIQSFRGLKGQKIKGEE